MSPLQKHCIQHSGSSKLHVVLQRSSHMLNHWTEKYSGPMFAFQEPYFLSDISKKKHYSSSSIHSLNKAYHGFGDTNWRKAEVLKWFTLKVKRGERQRNEKSSEWDTDTMGSRVVPSGVGPLNNSLSHPITPELPHLYPLHTHPHCRCHRCPSALWGSRH